MDYGRLQYINTNEDLDLVAELDNPATDLPEDITGFTVEFFLKSDLKMPDADAEIYAVAAILDQVTYKGQALFQLSAADTQIPEGRYWYGFNATEPSGRKTLLARFLVDVRQNPYSGV